MFTQPVPWTVPVRKVAARLVALLIFLAVSPAGATEYDDYIRARNLLEDDPQAAYDIAAKLPKFKHSDDVRISLFAEASLRTQRVGEAIVHLKEYESETKDDKERFRSKLERAELNALIGESVEASKLVKRLRSDVGRIKMGRAERHFFRSRIYRLQHDLAGETPSVQKSLARTLLMTYPTEPATLRPGLALKVTELSDSQRFRRANTLMDTWAYHEARSEFERLEKIKKYRETSSWNLGLIALRKLRDRPKEAETRFKELASKKGKYRERAMWYWARSLMRQNRYDDTFKVYEIYEKTYPKGNRIDDIYYYRGWLPYDARENKDAIKGLKKYIDRYGKRGAKSTYIYGFLAWAYMREKDWKNAIDAWNDMLSFGNTLVAGKALYWKAVAQKEQGKGDDAKKTLDTLRDRYTLSYYAMLGEQLRARMDGKSDKASEVWWPEGGGNVSDAPRMDISKVNLKLSRSERKVWNRVLELAALDEKHLARDAFKEIKSKVLASIPKKDKLEFIHALGWYIEDFNTMWNVSAGSIRAMPSFPIKDELKMVMAYPRAYDRVVGDVAAEFDVPPEFVWSIMRQESRYKPSAISYTDAVGALQMIPKTARLVAADLGTTYNLRTFFRPEVGFRFSGFYMKRILEYFEGLFVPAAASYNTGPQVIARWFHKNPDLPFDYLIEEFEYNEGRAYCRKVTEHMLRYVYLYIGDPAERAQLLDKMFPTSREIDVPQPSEIPY